MIKFLALIISIIGMGCGQQMDDSRTTPKNNAADATPSDTTGGNTPGGQGSDEVISHDQDASDIHAEENTRSFSCPKYPLVFHHGFMSGSKVGGFRGTKDMFKKYGCEYLETEVASVQTAAYRGAQLKTQIEAFLLKTGAAKVNIVAHSQGGLDARYAISKLGLASKVASLSTISTPHRGTPVADMALSSTGPIQQKVLSMFVNMMGKTINGNTPEPDTMAAVESLTEASMATFNADVTDSSAVYYQSWSSHTGTGSKDQTKTLLLLSHTLLTTKAGANDGVVPVASAKWGEWRGTLDADHFDQIGYKLLDARKSPFNPEDFYSKLAKELAAKGH